MPVWFLLFRQAYYFYKRFWKHSHGINNRHDLLLWNWYKDLWAESYHAFYSQADDYFYIDNGILDCHIKAFEKELEKEALYLKHNTQEDLQGSDLSSPLLCHGTVDCIRSVKDCLTAYQLRLVPWRHYYICILFLQIKSHINRCIHRTIVITFNLIKTKSFIDMYCTFQKWKCI